MYSENEILVLVEDIGEEGTDKFIAKGTEVIFLKVIDNPADLSKAMVHIKHGKRGLVVPEIAVTPKDRKKLVKALDEFNKAFLEQNPDLKRYHPNIILRYYYRFIHFIKGLINGRN
jgi:hypothetical protein